jgi:hypothetical protein
MLFLLVGSDLIRQRLLFRRLTTDDLENPTLPVSLRMAVRYSVPDKQLMAMHSRSSASFHLRLLPERHAG